MTSNTAFDGNGGGIYNDVNGALITVGTTFEANIAAGNGGAVYNAGFFQSEANIFDANAGLNGGGIYNAVSSYLTVNQNFFEGNLSDIGPNGGAGYIQQRRFGGRKQSLFPKRWRPWRRPLQQSGTRIFVIGSADQRHDWGKHGCRERGRNI